MTSLTTPFPFTTVEHDSAVVNGHLGTITANGVNSLLLQLALAIGKLTWGGGYGGRNGLTEPLHAECKDVWTL